MVHAYHVCRCVRATLRWKKWDLLHLRALSLLLLLLFEMEAGVAATPLLARTLRRSALC